MPELDPNQPDLPTEHFVGLLGQVQLRLQAYVMMLLPNWADADDVLQNTNIALWRRFEDYDPSMPFLPWARGVALIEVKRFRQTKGRDRLTFSEAMLDAIDETIADESDRLSQERSALSVCMNRLSNRDRFLVERVYCGGEKVAEIAANEGGSVGSLYVRLHRIRRSLLRCITRRLDEEGT